MNERITQINKSPDRKPLTENVIDKIINKQEGNNAQTAVFGTKISSQTSSEKPKEGIDLNLKSAADILR